MKMKLVFATNNAHKLEEIREMAGGQYEIVSLKEIGCQEEIPEEQDTLEGNALQKARFVKERYGADCFADDTGLEIAALGGEPGVRSARYAGEGHDSEANMRKVLAKMEGVDDRRARFRTVIALILDGEEHLFEGEVRGEILREKHGAEGFGYDPIFLCAEEGCAGKTFGEASPEEKDAVSHRGRSLRLFVEKLENYLKDKGEKELC